jgi:hypothetical protein
MQFVDEGVFFTISEAKESEKVSFAMDDGNNPQYGHFIEFGLDDLVRLRDWLNESIKVLQE